MKFAIALTLLLALTQTQAANSDLTPQQKKQLKKEFQEAKAAWKSARFTKEEKIQKKQCIVDTCLEPLGLNENDCGFCIKNCMEQVITKKQNKLDNGNEKSKAGFNKTCFKNCKESCGEVSRNDWSEFKVCKKGCWKN